MTLVGITRTWECQITFVRRMGKVSSVSLRRSFPIYVCSFIYEIRVSVKETFSMEIVDINGSSSLLDLKEKKNEGHMFMEIMTRERRKLSVH